MASPAPGAEMPMGQPAQFAPAGQPMMPVGAQPSQFAPAPGQPMTQPAQFPPAAFPGQPMQYSPAEVPQPIQYAAAPPMQYAAPSQPMQYAPADAPQPVQYATAAPAPYAAAPAQPVQFGTAPAPESQPMTYSTAPAGAAPIAYAAVPQPMPYAPVDAQPVQYAAPPMQYAAAPAQTMQYAPGEAPQPVQFAGAAPLQFAAGPGQPMPMQYAPAEAQPIQYASAEGQPVQFAPAPVTYAAPLVQGQTVQYAAPAGFDPGSWSPTPGAVVQLDGVVGAPEQNGRIGTVEGFDNENGRIIVLLSDNGERRGVRPENLVPAETSQPGAVQMMAAGADGEPAMWTPVPGSVVRLSNVAGAPEQNGRIGTVEAFDQENNRFVILFEDGERRGAKAENLEPAQMP